MNHVLLAASVTGADIYRSGAVGGNLYGAVSTELEGGLVEEIGASVGCL